MAVDRLAASFLDGALTRLLDPDTVLGTKIAEFVRAGDFGLASGATAAGQYAMVWHREEVPAEDIAFENGVFLLTKDKAEELTQASTASSPPYHDPPSGPSIDPKPETGPGPIGVFPVSPSQKVKLSITGTIPRESWNRLGTNLMPKLHGGEAFNARVELSAIVSEEQAKDLKNELRQTMADFGLDLQIDIGTA